MRRTICGPRNRCDDSAGQRRKSCNAENYQVFLDLGTITDFIQGQRIQWLGRIECRKQNEPSRAAFGWVPQG